MVIDVASTTAAISATVSLSKTMAAAGPAPEAAAVLPKSSTTAGSALAEAFQHSCMHRRTPPDIVSAAVNANEYTVTVAGRGRVSARTMAANHVCAAGPHRTIATRTVGPGQASSSGIHPVASAAVALRAGSAYARTAAEFAGDAESVPNFVAASAGDGACHAASVTRQADGISASKMRSEFSLEGDTAGDA